MESDEPAEFYGFLTFPGNNVATPKKKSGSRLWSTEVDGPVRSIDFSASDHWTAVGFNNGDVHAIDPDGKVVWENNVGPPVLQVRILPVKKRIVVLNEYSQLMAFDYSGKKVFNKGFKSYWTSFEIQSGKIVLWGWKSPPLKLNAHGKTIQELPIPHPWRRLKAVPKKDRFWVVHNEVCLGLYDSGGTNLWLVNNPSNINLSRTHPSDIEVDDAGHVLAVACHDKGVYLYNGEDNTLKHIDLDKNVTPYRESKKIEVDLSPDLVEKVVQATLGLTRNEAENVYAKALITQRKFGWDDLPAIISEKKQLIRKSGILDFIGLSTTLNNVGGMGRLKDWLQQRSTAFSARAREYGLPEPKGLLMLGVQGCGKSLSARAIAAEWNLPLLRLDVGKIFNSFIGNSEENMRKAIALAEAMSPAVLWLDEIEKGFSGIQSSGSVDSGVTSRVFATFLTWMQEKTKPVFVIATANDIEGLPPELLRKGRFDEIFFIDLPQPAERKMIFEIHIQLKKRDPAAYDIDRLAGEADQFSGAEIEQAILSAMYRAFAEDREFTTEDISMSVQETVPLAVTAREKIDYLRDWASHRARPAS